MAVLMGMKGTGDWAEGVRPTHYREGLLRLYPNGDMPLTAMLSMLKNESVDDPQFNWFTRTLTRRGGTLTNLYTDATLATPYVSGGIAGATEYAKVTNAVGDEFRAGHQVLLRDADDVTVDVVAKVVEKYREYTAGYTRLTLKLLEADNNSSHGHYLADADTILVIGNINPEGGDTPTSIFRQATKQYNYCQIFKTPIDVSNTALKTKYRTEKNPLAAARRDGLEDHGIEIENALMWGIKTETAESDENGKPERTTEGLIPSIRANASGNIFEFQYDADTAYTGAYFASGTAPVGHVWLNEKLSTIFKYGADEKMAFCGNNALLLINALILNVGQYQLKQETIAYGIKVTRWITPFGDILLKRHPLFAHEVSNAGLIVIFEPKEFRYKFLNGRDTHRVALPTTKDATIEEYRTECGLEIHHFEKSGLLNLVARNLVGV